MMPQYIVLMLIALSLGISLAKHGEPKDEKYNFWISLLSEIITIALLGWGGFFDGMF